MVRSIHIDFSECVDFGKYYGPHYRDVEGKSYCTYAINIYHNQCRLCLKVGTTSLIIPFSGGCLIVYVRN